MKPRIVTTLSGKYDLLDTNDQPVNTFPFDTQEEAFEWRKNNYETRDVIKPDYYKAGEYDVIAFCEYHKMGFALGNVIKYVTRAGKKDTTKELEDLKKAKEYLERKMEKLKADQK